jgi:aspartyl-tRNA(Asn)/glutamyl-tRNA(Gln) amidotransferase subunit C
MIDLKEVKHIAGLARIDFSEKELKGLQKELSSILDYFNKLKELDVENIEPASHSACPVRDSSLCGVVLKNVTREDKAAKKNLNMSKKLLELAPQTKGRFIKVKSVL